MPIKPISVFKLTPVQIDLIERLIAGDGKLAMGDLSYREVVAYQEISKLGLVELQVGKRQKLWVFLTEEGRRAKEAGYFSSRVVVLVTESQINLLRYLDDGPPEDSVGRNTNELPGMMLDICRSMALRGWVEWHEGWNGQRWARLSREGRDLLRTIDTTLE